MQRLGHRLHLAYLVSNNTRISRAKTALQNEIRDNAHIAMGALSLSTTGESSAEGRGPSHAGQASEMDRGDVPATLSLVQASAT